ncbi:uncharacterized protein J4E92_002084 [Alternaria infectoria]|uniref:uncharacterized protein n=1 Tax=Alternaria infectoria TaxID=45303 RepID=UPI00221F391D|nr:uncharacterized protein J4E92_002084 [Alternaria infectoria]KAI4937354.1 hypothetical protein J4E92_002084 [Alternaria infectoria]
MNLQSDASLEDARDNVARVTPEHNEMEDADAEREQDIGLNLTTQDLVKVQSDYNRKLRVVNQRLKEKRKEDENEAKTKIQHPEGTAPQDLTRGKAASEDETGLEENVTSRSCTSTSPGVSTAATSPTETMKIASAPSRRDPVLPHVATFQIETAEEFNDLEIWGWEKMRPKIYQFGEPYTKVRGINFKDNTNGGTTQGTRDLLLFMEDADSLDMLRTQRYSTQFCNIIEISPGSRQSFKFYWVELDHTMKSPRRDELKNKLPSWRKLTGLDYKDIEPDDHNTESDRCRAPKSVAHRKKCREIRNIWPSWAEGADIPENPKFEPLKAQSTITPPNSQPKPRGRPPGSSKKTQALEEKNGSQDVLESRLGKDKDHPMTVEEEESNTQQTSQITSNQDAARELDFPKQGSRRVKARAVAEKRGSGSKRKAPAHADTDDEDERQHGHGKRVCEEDWGPLSQRTRSQNNATAARRSSALEDSMARSGFVCSEDSSTDASTGSTENSSQTSLASSTTQLASSTTQLELMRKAMSPQIVMVAENELEQGEAQDTEDWMEEVFTSNDDESDYMADMH